MGLALVNLSVAPSVFGAQRKPKRNRPLVVRTSGANPFGGWVVLVSAPIRFPRARIARDNSRNLQNARLVHVPRGVQKLCRFQDHLDAVLVAVIDGRFQGVGVQKKKIHIFLLVVLN